MRIWPLYVNSYSRFLHTPSSMDRVIHEYTSPASNLNRVVTRREELIPRFNPHAMSPVLLSITDRVLHNLPSSAINQLEKQYVGSSSMQMDQLALCIRYQNGAGRV
jgi:hypothetical protein